MKQKEKQKRFRKLRIVSLNFDVVYKNPVLDESNNVLCGQIIHEKLTIEIDSAMPYEKQLESLFHEALHGIFWKMSISQDDDIRKDVEDTVISLNTGLTCFIRDNPEFIMEYMRVLNGV